MTERERMLYDIIVHQFNYALDLVELHKEESEHGE